MESWTEQKKYDSNFGKLRVKKSRFVSKTKVFVFSAIVKAGLVRGGQEVQNTGARHILRGPWRGPALMKFFFRDARDEMLEKLRLRYVKTYVQSAK